VAISIRSSLQLTAAHVAELEGLVGTRNRFVCLQLVVMVKEQHAKNQAALASGDELWLQQAELVFLATIAVGGQLVGGALFYPRLPKSGAAAPSQSSAAVGPAPVQLPLPITRTISLTVRAGPAAGDDGTPAAGWPPQGDAAAAAAAAGAAGSQVDAASELQQSWSALKAANSSATAQPHVYVELIAVNAPGKWRASFQRLPCCYAWPTSPA
jgi:hypothetical protein